ncbi:hypothetical protein HL652_03795 [Herbiconiux sp. SALV-R1]|nr:hypothetical protein [Herbiconiux sp. SALV-R1]QJU52843.1 hypothetical protein HL652_03795 [Herbiconiux sp. SALV-R1]
MVLMLIVLAFAAVLGVIATVVDLARDGYRPRAVKATDGIRDPFAEEAQF